MSPEWRSLEVAFFSLRNFAYKGAPQHSPIEPAAENSGRRDILRVEDRIGRVAVPSITSGTVNKLRHEQADVPLPPRRPIAPGSLAD
jgi:hypothetical protein